MTPAHTVTDDLAFAGYILATMVATSITAIALVKRDERRLSATMLDRAWPPATRDTVLGLAVLLGGVLPVAFGVFLHFVRTRRSLRGIGLGLAGFVVTFLPAIALSVLLSVLMPDLPDLE